jgi:hypothetical protein
VAPLEVKARLRHRSGRSCRQVRLSARISSRPANRLFKANEAASEYALNRACRSRDRDSRFFRTGSTLPPDMIRCQATMRAALSNRHGRSGRAPHSEFLHAPRSHRARDDIGRRVVEQASRGRTTASAARGTRPRSVRAVLRVGSHPPCSPGGGRAGAKSPRRRTGARATRPWAGRCGGTVSCSSTRRKREDRSGRWFRRLGLLFFVELGSLRVHLAGFFMVLQRPQVAPNIWPDTTYSRTATTPCRPRLPGSHTPTRPARRTHPRIRCSSLTAGLPHPTGSGKVARALALAALLATSE